MIRTILMAMLLAVLVSGCATNRETGALSGGAAGAGIGALIGDGAAGPIIGGLLGVIVGSEIGREMDKRDRRYVANTLENSPSGRRSEWVNPDSGNRYEVTPREAYRGSGGRPCREFVLTSDEFNNPVYGTACRRADGTWHMVD